MGTQTDKVPNEYRGEYLGVQNLAAALKCSYGTLRRYAEIREVAQMMGGVAVAGKYGLRYPVASMGRWRQLLDLHQARAVTPQTAAAVLAVLHGEAEGNGRLATKSEIVSPANTGSVVAELSRITAALDRIAAAQEQMVGRKRRRKRKTKG